jgi:eukaryotic translation initiation factor 2C
MVRPGQAYGAKLTAEQTKEMINFAVRRPHQNAQSIVTNGARMLGFNPNNSTLVSLLA